jgi:glyoxylase-like metal-dependent hydrolase (beta-lactamase superfamily II)
MDVTVTAIYAPAARPAFPATACSPSTSLRGADSGEITQVVNSSYHFDHVSGNKHCGYSHLECAGIGPSYELPSGGTEIAA